LAYKYAFCCSAIWSCIKFEDVLEVLPMFILEKFMDWFVFIWGHELCTKTVSQISPMCHYYLKDLKCVYYGCHGLLYGKEDQTLLIDDEPSKVLWKSKCSGLFLKSFKGQTLSKNKVQWLDLTSCLWPPLVGLALPKTTQVHYDFMVKYFKPQLSSSLKDYYWFFQYMGSDNGNVCNVLPFLCIKYSESFYFIISFFFHFVNFFLGITFYTVIYFHMPLFSSINFCLQLIWIVVHRLDDIVYKFEKEKKMLTIQFFILKWCWCCIFEHGQSQN